MSETPIIVLEDTDLDPNDKTAAGLPRQVAGHRFTWHPTLACGITSHEALERFVQFLSGEPDKEWGSLPAPAIVVLDLRYTTSLTDQEDGELMKWLEGHYKADALQKHGLYVFGRLLQNQSWRGLVMVATTEGNSVGVEQAVKALCSRFAHPNIYVEFERDALTTTGNARHVIDQAIACYLARFGSLQARLWPAETADWFSDRSTVVNHRQPSPGTDDWTQRTAAIRSYLRNQCR